MLGLKKKRERILRLLLLVCGAGSRTPETRQEAPVLKHRPWTRNEERKLIELEKAGKDTGIIARRLAKVKMQCGLNWLALGLKLLLSRKFIQQQLLLRKIQMIP